MLTVMSPLKMALSHYGKCATNVPTYPSNFEYYPTNHVLRILTYTSPDHALTPGRAIGTLIARASFKRYIVNGIAVVINSVSAPI